MKNYSVRLQSITIQIILEVAIRNALAVQDFVAESLAKLAHMGEHSQIGKAPMSASDSGSKDCAVRAFPIDISRIIVGIKAQSRCGPMS